MKRSAPVRKLPSNIQGKDYVVGDLHGCIHLLKQLMEEVEFDTTKDRLFSVGDLIDRGPDSLSCLQLLEEPWFYAVQGNHELMMLNFFFPYLMSGKIKNLNDVNDTGFVDNGGDWIENYFDSHQERMSAEFNRGLSMALEMPILWVVGEGDDRFHIIHAELVRADYQTSKQVVWLDSDIDRWLAEESILPEVEDKLYWGRTLMLSQLIDLDSTRIQKGLSTTFCGHTYATKPRQALSHVCLDTGAFLSFDADKDTKSCFGLTLLDIHKKQWYCISYNNTEVLKKNQD